MQKKKLRTYTVREIVDGFVYNELKPHNQAKWKSRSCSGG